MTTLLKMVASSRLEILGVAPEEGRFWEGGRLQWDVIPQVQIQKDLLLGFFKISKVFHLK